MGRRPTKSRPEPLALTEELLEAHEDQVLGGATPPDEPFVRAPEPPDEPAVPPAAPRRPRHPHLGAALVVVYVVIVNVLAALTAYFAINERENALLRSQQRAASMTRVMEEHVARTFGEVDRVLQSIAGDAARAGGLGGMTEVDARALMAARQHTLPQSHALVAITASGRVVAATAEQPVRELNLAGAPYFDPQPDDENATHLGRAVREPFSGQWAIPASHRVETAGGLFGGSVVAFVSPMYFENLYRDLDLPPGTTLSIAREDGYLLAHHPGGSDMIDTRAAGLPQAHDGSANGRDGSFTAVGRDGVTRLASYRRLPRAGLVVSVAVPLDAALASWEQSTLITGLGAAVLALLIGIILIVAYHELRRRSEAEAALRLSNQQLEERIRERTAALEQSNRQLAAFSYSVSHDLRAPLRAINGFCQALEEDYGAVLDTAGVGYLKRVRRASERMGELIDSMVELTSLSRAAVRRARTDLSAIAQDIANELAESEPRRAVIFDISPGLVTNADSRLVRILLAQLIDNAWKFTRDTAEARISFGAVDEDGETAYFVDDNGVGFDMSHAGKLFTPFHRLHAGDDYEGFGIGLATVKHIVELHDGRAWADAVPGRGVAMYFTLAAKRAPR